MTLSTTTSRMSLGTMISAIACLSLGLSLLLPATGRATERPLPVFVSILPQAGFVAEIGGPLVDVQVLVGPGHSPATYEPTPRQMAALSQARVFFCAGVPFERGLVPKVAGLASAPLIAGRQIKRSAASSSHKHDHGAGLDAHSWLDPIQAMALTDTICLHLSRLMPAEATGFATRRDEIKKRLADLDTDIRETLSPWVGAEFFVFHPAYGHFARRYGLVQIAVEAGGREPSARQLATVIDQAKAAGARVIVVQPQFSRRSAQSVAQAIGAEILVLDPLAGDYEANLRHIAAALASALASAPGFDQ